jgi:hypothetical protein
MVVAIIVDALLFLLLLLEVCEALHNQGVGIDQLLLQDTREGGTVVRRAAPGPL